MLFFLFRVIVNTVILAVTVWLLPGLAVTATWWQSLLMGFIFTLLNEFVRPFFVFISSRMLIRSLGLFIVIVNALIFELLVWTGGRLGMGEWYVSSIVTALVAGALIGVLMTIFDAVLGINRPLLHNLSEGKGVWRFVSGLPLSSRSRIVSNVRFMQVWDTIWRYGLDIGLSKTPIGPVRDAIARTFNSDALRFARLSTPAQVRELLQVLGPTYVKFGQMVSSRSDSLPAEWKQELNALQSDVAAFPGKEAVALVEEALSAPVAELYAAFEVEPFAAASTAQVHRATLHDGTRVVVKVQRPLITPKVNADLSVLRDLVAALELRSAYAADNNLSGILGEFAANLVRELDYTNEAYNARRLRVQMEPMPGIHVPAVYTRLTTPTVMTQEYVQGVKITKVEEIGAAGLDRTQIALNFLRAMIKQILFDGFFHGDPHPGNVLVDLKSGDVIFLDMGMMGQITLEQRMNVADLLWALSARDPYELANVFLRLTRPFREVNVKQFRTQMEELINRHMVYAAEGDSFSNVLNATLTLLYESGLRMDSAMTLTLKALVQAEEIVRLLDPSLWIVDEGFRFTQELLWEEMTLDSLTAQAQKQVNRTLRELLRRLPELTSATTKWLDQYQQGKVTLVIDTASLDSEIAGASVSARYIAVALMMLGIIVGAGIATQMEGDLLGVSYSEIAFLLLFIGVTATLALAWRIVRAVARRPTPRLIE